MRCCAPPDTRYLKRRARDTSYPCVLFWLSARQLAQWHRARQSRRHRQHAREADDRVARERRGRHRWWRSVGLQRLVRAIEARRSSGAARAVEAELGHDVAQQRPGLEPAPVRDGDRAAARHPGPAGRARARDRRERRLEQQRRPVHRAQREPHAGVPAARRRGPGVRDRGEAAERRRGRGALPAARRARLRRRDPLAAGRRDRAREHDRRAGQVREEPRRADIRGVPGDAGAHRREDLRLEAGDRRGDGPRPHPHRLRAERERRLGAAGRAHGQAGHPADADEARLRGDGAAGARARHAQRARPRPERLPEGAGRLAERRRLRAQPHRAAECRPGLLLWAVRARLERVRRAHAGGEQPRAGAGRSRRPVHGLRPRELHPRPPADLGFTPEQTRDVVWATERSHEAYVKSYAIVFPHDQPLAGRNFRTGPFHELLVGAGAVMEERQGWERPGWFLRQGTAPVPAYDYYGSYGTARNRECRYTELLRQEASFDFPAHFDHIREEALACRGNAALFDASYLGKFYLCGPDAQKAADFLFTGCTDAEVDRTVYTCMLNKRGGTEADCTITWILPGSSGVVDPIFKGKALYVVSAGLSAYHAWAHIRRIVADKGFNVSFHNATDQMGVLSLQGPNSAKILQNLVDADLAGDDFPFSSSKLVRANGKLVRAFRISFVGELGYELHIPIHHCEKVFRGIVELGKPWRLKLAGYRALYSLSCEKGFHLWNSDLRSDDNPIEANLGFTCRKDGKYLGSDAVDNLRKNGVKRKLVSLHVKHQVPMWGLETVYRNGEIVGYLTRAEYAHTFGYSIGHSYIKHPQDQILTNEFLQSGEYQVQIMGKMYPAQMYLKSPFDPHNKRLLNEYDQL
ncbi:sarcosine dehydrogenase, mitochondrial-like isoform X2 [Phymastichus coffea]|uniref:sarcosine dehydrogenase, mitochondrial-like isoform X2 n=1 Tax=Phymastichus coffea TaxID=108790 RepID=UPI00273BDC91|nr:sarcosine dehydrogenase, mitochondrial-like isoform X2 [Phymastichus coffea]